ncbi:MAG TPA: DUF3857 domain-containing protein [Candidatus Polarisedimenticolia bacterium]|nr:DUF3857 domain-containing protein [Candidatus Polarisedimenticolia bacterium]
MRKARHGWSLGLASLVLALVPPGFTLAAKRDIDPNLIAIPDCPEEPGCPALVLLDETELSNESQRARLSRHRLVKIFTDQGVGEFADIDVIETIGLEEVKNLKGRTILPDGRVIQLAQDNIFVKPSYKKGRRRQRVKSAKFPGVVPGALIDYSYDLVDPRASYYSEWIWYLQDRIPVLEAKLALKPGGAQFAWLPSGLQKVDITHENPFKNVHYYTIKNIPALPMEPLAPADDVTRARVHFYPPSSQDTWLRNYASIFAGLAGAYLDEIPGIPEKVKDLVGADDPPIERVRKLYRFVQEKIGTEDKRLDETEESKVEEANNAGKVLARGYGDEFERTMLFLAMVKETGLPHALLLIAGRGNAILDTNLPDSNQFDSFAVAVKTSDDWTFYDPSAKHCPFGMISPWKEGGVVNAIQVTPEKGRGLATTRVLPGKPIPIFNPAAFRIVAIPFSAAGKNVLLREATIRLAADGSAKVNATEQGTGLVDFDNRRTYESLDAQQRRETFTENLHAIVPAAEGISVEFADLESFDTTARITYTFNLPSLGSGAGDKLLTTASLFGASKPVTFSAEKRRSEVHFPHSQKTVDRVVLEIPEGYAIDKLPAAELVREGPLLYVANYERQEGKVVLSRRLEIDVAVWTAANYPRLKSFFERVQNADRELIVLSRH